MYKDLYHLESLTKNLQSIDKMLDHMTKQFGFDGFAREMLSEDLKDAYKIPNNFKKLHKHVRNQTFEA